MGCRRLDEVAQHVVVLDLQAARSRSASTYSACIAAMTPRPSSRSAPRLVQFGVIPWRDKAAIARQQVAALPPAPPPAAPPAPHDPPVPAPPRAAAPAHRESRWRPPGLRQPGPDRRQVSRSAPVQREARQRPVDIRYPPQSLAQVGRATMALSTRNRSAVQPCVDHRTDRATAPKAAAPEAARRPAVTVRSIAASSDPSRPPDKACVNLEVAPRRGVDLHDAAHGLRAPAVRSSGILPALGKSKIVDKAPIAETSARSKLPKASRLPTPNSAHSRLSAGGTIERLPATAA